AKEIVETVDRPWIRQYHSFGNGELVLICVKVREGAPIINQELMNLFKQEEVCRIAAIKRGHQTIIPSGRDIIMTDDVVYFITTPEELETVRKLAGKPLEKVESVMIMGGSRIAILAAEKLSKTLNVKIIEQSRSRSEYIKERLGSKVMVIQGDGRDMDLLNDENIESMEAYIALTGSDETNIFSCLAAKRFGVPRSIAEVEQLDYIPLADNLDIGIVINKKLIAAGHIYQMMLDADVTNMKCLTFANADVAEFIVKENSKITKKQVKDLHLPENLSLGGLIRDGKGIIIYGNTQIQAGDRVVIFCLSSQIQKVEKYFH
ncbi:MAG: Trk system potassium transporter TrkA, partial [Bacteroidales bacterium]|nr:Trk system potassium transporter TrkA [Bacteroidales bacterium]